MFYQQQSKTLRCHGAAKRIVPIFITITNTCHDNVDRSSEIYNSKLLSNRNVYYLIFK